MSRNQSVTEYLQATIHDANKMMLNKRPDEEVVNYLNRQLKRLNNPSPYVNWIWDQSFMQRGTNTKVFSEEKENVGLFDGLVTFDDPKLELPNLEDDPFG